MIQILKYFLKVLVSFLLIFFAAKLFFLAVNVQAGVQDFKEFPVMWWNGLRLDLSIIGYILILPILLLLIRLIVKTLSESIFKYYFAILIVIIAIVLATDPFFYSYWGQKANLSFIQFLGKENAGIASIALLDFVLAIGFLIGILVFYFKSIAPCLIPPKKNSIAGVVVILALSVLMIRGGIGIVPINISSAFYSSNNLHNNTALNTIWNVMATELERDKHKALVFFDSDKEAEKVLENLELGSNSFDYLIKKDSASNVLLIVLESFSAKVSGLLSGEEFASTPNLDAIMKDGIYFENAYASSFRSDKGLLALTSGIPSGARQTLTNFPDKIASKPNLFREFDKSHHTSFYYGGNLEFANIKVLFNDANLVRSESDFNSKNKNTWGVHDEVVFDEFYNDFENESKPQFKMMFSLSSHEPFDVPNYKKKSDAYLNSISYTDSCLGSLYNKLKVSKKWDNTLIIITADHGTVRPDNAAIYDKTNFHIPLVITGGRVRKDTVIRDVVSQIDIPATIAAYKTGKNPFVNQQSILQPSGVAFYSYYIGLACIQNNCDQYYDFAQKKYFKNDCNKPFEKAYYQLSNAYFLGD